MQSNFEPKYIKDAKESLSNDLNIAKQHLLKHKEHQKELLKEVSLWQKIITIFNKYF